ncbi:MAG: hypothetical protein ACI97N_001031 [Cognaticolwellia sp.]|jgi:hypothetical protein
MATALFTVFTNTPRQAKAVDNHRCNVRKTAKFNTIH